MKTPTCFRVHTPNPNPQDQYKQCPLTKVFLCITLAADLISFRFSYNFRAGENLNLIQVYSKTKTKLDHLLKYIVMRSDVCVCVCIS